VKSPKKELYFTERERRSQADLSARQRRTALEMELERKLREKERLTKILHDQMESITNRTRDVEALRSYFRSLQQRLSDTDSTPNLAAKEMRENLGRDPAEAVEFAKRTVEHGRATLSRQNLSSTLQRALDADAAAKRVASLLPRPAQGRGRDLRQIFEKCDVTDTLRHLQQFAKSAPSASALTRSQVFTFVNRIADVHPSNYIEISRLIDALGNGDAKKFVDYRDLGSGLTVLCAGDSKTKISSAFGLLARTRDSTSFVTRNDVERYLVAVYKVVFLVDRSTKREVGISPEQLVERTLRDIFQEDSDGPSSDRISLAQFASCFAPDVSDSVPDVDTSSAPSSVETRTSNDPAPDVRVRENRNGSIVVDVRDGGDDLAVEEVLDRFHSFMKTRYRSVSNIFRRKDELGQKRLDVEAFEGAVAKLSKSDADFPLRSVRTIRTFCDAVAPSDADGKIGMRELYAAIFKYRMGASGRMPSPPRNEAMRSRRKGSVVVTSPASENRVYVNKRGSIFINARP